MPLIKPFDEVLFPEIEPGVINFDMIKKAYEDAGYKGEAGRLQSEESVECDKITALRLEFKNIIRIDHLWVLPNVTKLSLNFNKIEKIENLEMLVNLKELDLSFNYIEAIENLESLVNLETLSLFNNLIKNIENLDSLENLIILSLGNNQIKHRNGIERFRFLSKLKVLNLQGNPMAEKENFRKFIAATLPGLMYYEYSLVLNEEREQGTELFARELREIEQNEEEELERRKKLKKELEDEQRLSSSFVEHLNEHQLFESLWEGDEDGRALRMIGEDAEELVKEYKNDFFAITQEIYKIGLARYEEREIELRMFEKSLEQGQERAQTNGKRVVEEFLEFKDEIFLKVRDHMKELENILSSGYDESSSIFIAEDDKLNTVIDNYGLKIESVWQELMEDELMLFESIEEAIGNFERNINEMITVFIEHTQTYFISLRDVAMNFSENINGATSRYITFMMASGLTKEVPKELHECLEDKDAIMNLVAGMRDHQMQKIDAREDKLVTRGRNWVESLIDNLKADELERNRVKINEINYFLDQMRDALDDYRQEITDSFEQEDD